MDPTIFTDPNLVIKVGKELQRRIGTLPLVEIHPFHLESKPGEIVRMLRVQPQSYSEIARTVRAARTLKLSVRACGERTGGDCEIYGGPSTVLVDCSLLADSPRLEFVNILRKGDKEETPGLRILSCVGINELVDFQISNRVEVAQSVETVSVWGTVVGAITSSSPGIAGPGGSARGGCLADEVICIRIVDCHGDLIQYTSDEELTCALSTLGILGIVYDVTVRYRPLSMTKVNFKYMKWVELLDPGNDVLRNSVATSQFTEIVYLPYNGCPSEEHSDSVVQDWQAIEDEVCLRTGQQISIDPSLEDAPLVDSSERQQIHLIDPTFGPKVKEFLSGETKIPWLLGRAHHYLRRRFQPNSTSIQYTPWALNSLGKMSEPLRILRFTIQTTPHLKEFREVMLTVFQLLQDLAKGGPRYRKNYAINLGLRVHFTGPTKTGRLLGVGLDLNGTEAKNIVLAHITFSGITLPGPCTLWTRAANHTTNVMLRSLPLCVPQWKTEWHNIEAIKKRYQELLEPQVEPMKQLVAIADRDGVFLNELLMAILYPEPTFYQKLYRNQRVEAISWIALDTTCTTYGL